MKHFTRPDEFPPLSPLSENIPSVLAVAPKFGTLTTCVDLTVHKVKFVSIPNTGYPVNIILSLIARKIKTTTNLNHSVVYGTAGLSITKSIVAYLSLVLLFGKLVLTVPAVVLENDLCNLLT